MSSTVESPELDQVESTVSRGGPTLMQIAWQRKSLVILGIMLGLVLGLLYYVQKQPTYQSLSQMLIVKKTPNDQLNLGQCRVTSRTWKTTCRRNRYSSRVLKSSDGPPRSRIYKI